jgi:hypothetical protein
VARPKGINLFRADDRKGKKQSRKERREMKRQMSFWETENVENGIKKRDASWVSFICFRLFFRLVCFSFWVMLL